MQFTIRNYLPQDFQRLWEIDQLCFAPGIAYSRHELGIYIRRRSAITLIAENASSEIAGFLTADITRKRTGHIITIDVLTGARKHGVGSTLLQTAEQRLAALSCRVVYLETAVDNMPAISFYKKHAYDVIETVPRYYSNGVDALVLAKKLDAHLPQHGPSR